MTEFTGTKLVTNNPTAKSLAPSEASEKATPVEGFRPANWELKKQ